MASIKPRGIVLSQTATFGSKKQDLVATLVAERFKRDSGTRQATNELDGYLINVLSPRTGEAQSVKLPLSAKPVYEEIKEALEAEKSVRVTFNGTFKGKFWAMLDDAGRITTGISATASDLAIVAIEEEDGLSDDDIIID